jgi:hypothetical protein
LAERVKSKSAEIAEKRIRRTAKTSFAGIDKMDQGKFREAGETGEIEKNVFPKPTSKFSRRPIDLFTNIIIDRKVFLHFTGHGTF